MATGNAVFSVADIMMLHEKKYALVTIALLQVSGATHHHFRTMTHASGNEISHQTVRVDDVRCAESVRCDRRRVDEQSALYAASPTHEA